MSTVAPDTKCSPQSKLTIFTHQIFDMRSSLLCRRTSYLRDTLQRKQTDTVMQCAVNVPGPVYRGWAAGGMPSGQRRGPEPPPLPPSCSGSREHPEPSCQRERDTFIQPVDAQDRIYEYIAAGLMDP